MMKQHTLVSIVVPVYNESAGIDTFHDSLVRVLEGLPEDWEIVYCDDGSRDGTVGKISLLTSKNIRLVALSRNFGKEYALAAGIAEAAGDAIVTLDGDGQHPVELIPAFVEAWREGAMMVVGKRLSSKSSTAARRIGSRLFYRFAGAVSESPLTPDATDFCLIDSHVREQFLRLEENGRMSRSLLSWLGFAPVFIEFEAKERVHGKNSYSTPRLFGLAGQTLVSLSFLPLYFFGMLGLFITVSSGTLGVAVLFEQYVFHDALSWNFTGTAQLGILTLFLVGIILMSVGMLSVYIAAVLREVRGRPLYVVDKKHSKGLRE